MRAKQSWQSKVLLNWNHRTQLQMNWLNKSYNRLVYIYIFLLLSCQTKAQFRSKALLIKILCLIFYTMYNVRWKSNRKRILDTHSFIVFIQCFIEIYCWQRSNNYTLIWKLCLFQQCSLVKLYIVRLQSGHNKIAWSKCVFGFRVNIVG